jgi:hypothetical protein
MGAMTQRDPEYDAFGPWVLEITDRDPPPPLYVPYLDRTESALLSVKIPRHIERRRAHPGMDLYDYVVSLYEQDMVILKRVDHEVETQTFRYRDVQHLRVSEELLRGVLHLAMPDTAYDLPYNTVSHELIGRLVNLIRERYLPQAEARAPAVSIRPADDELSFYFEHLLDAALADDPAMRLLAAQPEIALGAASSNTLHRIVVGIVDKRLLEALHLSDGRELTIIGRGHIYAYRWQTIYGTDICYLPTANVSAAEWSGDGGASSLIDLVLRTRASDVAYAFTPGNPALDTYRDYLASLPGVRRGGS